jgi:SAM-dependent methyltransferase
MNLVAQTPAGEVPNAVAQTLVCEVPTQESQTEVCATGILHGLKRRLARERRRRKVGRAYDMALEIARIIPKGSEVLDVGCGNGFIAHHLSAILDTNVSGIDVMDKTEAPIGYRRYDREQFPAPDKSFDAVLLCYVLHHAQDATLVMNEVRRVLRAGGVAIIYEDIPQSWWDKGMCLVHDLLWKRRTGPCTFQTDSEWCRQFSYSGFELVKKRALSRTRNFTHPVARRTYVIRRADCSAVALSVEC